MDRTKDNLFSFGFNKENIKETIKWGFYGGVLISLIQFPYKLFYATDISEFYLDYLLKLKTNMFY